MMVKPTQKGNGQTMTQTQTAIKVHLDIQQYQSKPDSAGAGRITTRIPHRVVSVTPQELADAVGNKGQTVCLGIMGEINGEIKKRKEHLLYQEACFLDFDNSWSPSKGEKLPTEGADYSSLADALQDSYFQENASFLYKTFSHQEGWDHYRVAFLFSRPLVSNEEVEAVYRYLFSLYPNCDHKTIDSSRLFYGGTQAIEINFNNRLDVDAILNASVPVAQSTPAKTRAKAVTQTQTVLELMTEQDAIQERIVPTWKLIKQGDKAEVARRWAEIIEPQVIADEDLAINYLKSIDMAQLLGITRNPFHDIFEADSTPSAGIWKPADKDYWLYTQQNKVNALGHKMSYSLVRVIEKLLTTPTKTVTQGMAIDYLIEVSPIEIKVTPEIAEMRRQAERFKRIILSSTFKEDNPSMYKILGRYIPQVNAIIDILKMSLYQNPETGELQALTRMSSENIALRIGVSKQGTKELLTLMTLTHITEKLDDEDIPAWLLNQLQFTQKNYKDKNGNIVERKTPRQYRGNILKLSNLEENFPKIVERTEELVALNYTKKGQSREFVELQLGKAEADRVYPQDKKRTVSKKTKGFQMEGTKFAMRQVQTNGFVVENDIKDYMTGYLGGVTITDAKWKTVRGSLTSDYMLERVKLNKQRKTYFGVSEHFGSRTPFIYTTKKALMEADAFTGGATK